MIRRTLFMAAVVVVALAVTIPANPQGAQPGRWGQFWGTWVHWAHFGTGQKFPALVTISVDGTLTVSGGTGIHGVWERTGVSSIRATSLLQNLDAAGSVIGLERHRCSLDYSDDFNSYQGTEFAETVSCPTPLTCPDPLDPETKWTPASWAPPAGIQVSATRVGLVAPGSLK